MGNTLFIKERIVCVKPLRTMLEDIQKLKTSNMIEGSGCFADMIDFLNLFFLELQK